MERKYENRLFLGFLHLHILYHASQQPFYGAWILEELREHGYHIGPSHLYPLLKEMTKSGFLEMESRTENNKMRKYYQISESGKCLMNELMDKVKELTDEVFLSKNMIEDQI